LVRRATRFKILTDMNMFRTAVLLANIIAASGVAACALVHAASLIGPTQRLAGQIFASTILAVFPLCGLAIILALRVKRTYRVRGHLPSFIGQRAPRWLHRASMCVFAYALIHFVAFATIGARTAPGTTHVPLLASAFVAAFYLTFMEVFTVGLNDPTLVEPKARRREQPLPTRPQTLDGT